MARQPSGSSVRRLTRRVFIGGLMHTMGGGPSFARTANCKRIGPIGGTFVQPTGTEFSFAADQWRVWLSSVSSLGIETLYVQWSRLADVGTIQARALLEASQHAGMSVHLGLWQQHGLDNRLYGSAAETTAVLSERRAKSLELARVLAREVHYSKAFAGWYLCEEPSDLMLQDLGRASAWAHHLERMGEALTDLIPQAPVTISTYVSGQMPPAQFADFWRSSWRRTRALRLLLQDGFGVQFLPEGGTTAYFEEIERLKPGGARAGLVIETFEQLAGLPINNEPFRSKPAALDRLARQIELAQRLSKHPLVAFTVPDYMIGKPGSAAARLGDAYRERYLPPLPCDAEAKP